MFRRFFIERPVRSLNSRLKTQSPDQNLWDRVSAYLVKGRWPQDPKAQAVLRSYLDLREGLGGLAAFKTGASLSHEALWEPCCRFFEAYETPAGLEAEESARWASFCLGADSLLSEAAQVCLTSNQKTKETARRMDERFQSVRRDYLDPMAKADLLASPEFDSGQRLAAKAA